MGNRLAREVRLMSMGISDGETESGCKCPKCHGGGTGERSFNVTREGNKLKFFCHRASCKFFGVLPIDPAQAVRPVPQPKTHKVFSYITRKLTTEERRFFYEKYSIYQGETDDWLFAPEIQRVCMPIRNHVGVRVGWNARKYNELTDFKLNPWEAKSLIYMDDQSADKIHFEKWDKEDNEFIIVEDMVSAKKAARYKNTIALLGTHMPISLVELLVNNNIEDIGLALDADAWDKAIKLKQEHSLLFRNFRLIPLSKDIKDMKDNDIQAKIYGQE